MASATALAPVVLGAGVCPLDVPDTISAWPGDGLITVNTGFQLAVETGQRDVAERDGHWLVSIRLWADEAHIGPLWTPAGGACAGCAEVRTRHADDHPLSSRYDINLAAAAGWPASLGALVEVGLVHLVRRPLAPGEMLVTGLRGTARHRVRRSFACPICRPAAPQRSPSLALVSRPSAEPVPLRGQRSTLPDHTLPDHTMLDDASLRGLVDRRVGPVRPLWRDSTAPFAMTGALIPGARAPGYGRGRDFAAAAPVAILEAYERLGAVPHQGQVLNDLAYDEVGDLAVDPSSLGWYTEAQLDHPNARVMAYRPDIAMDWAFGYRLGDGEARLVPADVAFYGYRYRGRPKAHYFAESSSGCALGSSIEEAALHGLLELIERDSFLAAWYRRTPLPEIRHDSLADPTSAMLLEGIEGRGYDAHLLVTTVDLGVPAIWALAVNRSGAIPAAYSAAGSGPDPATAVRAALWELGQLVASPLDWDVEAVRPLVDDPSLVDTLEDHVHLYAMPAMADRHTAVLGGPLTGLADAFPGWPDELGAAAGGDVLGSLRYLLGRCQAAGLDDAVVVDQSTSDHIDLGFRVVKVVLPGILPMCFGAPQQRLSGLPRMPASADPLFDPHPFP